MISLLLSYMPLDNIMTHDLSATLVNTAYDRMQEIKRDYQIKKIFCNAIALVLLACAWGSYHSFHNEEVNTGWIMIMACIFTSVMFLVWSLATSMSEMKYKTVKKTYVQLLQKHEETFGKDDEK